MLFKPSVSGDFFWHCSGKRKSAPLLLPSGGRRPISPLVLCQHLLLLGSGGSDLVTLDDGVSPDTAVDPLSPPSDVWKGPLITDLWRWTSRLLAWWHWHCKGTLIPNTQDESPNSLVGLLWHQPIRDTEHLITTLWGWRFRHSTWPLRLEVIVSSVEFD